MTDNRDQIQLLLDKLEILLKRQDDFSREIDSLRTEINRLTIGETVESPKIEDHFVVDKTFEEEKKAVEKPTFQQGQKEKRAKDNSVFPKVRIDLEKFIGENLINKIGIIITVIGVAIGARYSIEHDLISPLTRIILGYISGIGLLGIGIRLKNNFESYSAVLVSGAVAIMYFITYFAYSYYELIPQLFSFALMVIFTIFTVLAAISYKRQIIAHLGLVGAYAVPFLLSDGSGNAAVLFTYIAIINVGILVISFKKYWKSLYFVSFSLTWIIFLFWFVAAYEIAEHFSLALTFLSIFFTTFYLTFLAYKLLKKEAFNIGDILLILFNSFIFYGIGYAILNNHEIGTQLLGLFTIFNAIIHFVVGAIVFRQKLADRNIFYLVVGLVLVFVTIAIPVQLDGNWVSLLWVGEAALLFWIGRTKNISIYEKLSYPLMILASLSIFQDWSIVYNSYNPEYPETRVAVILNVNFLTSLLFIAAFGFINFINQSEKYQPSFKFKNELYRIIPFIIPCILLFTLYYAFRIEIESYWNQLFKDSLLSIEESGGQFTEYYNYDLINFKTIWIINYSILFFSILSFVNTRKLKSKALGLIAFVLSVLVIFSFLSKGLYLLSELRESYLEQTLSDYYEIGLFNIGIRYISFALFALIMFASSQYIRQKFIKYDLKVAFNYFFHISVIWILSSELINWLDVGEFTASYKLGLSILWGVYSLFLISFGIWKKKKHLRILAIALFGVTLIKLFFYDISHLDTIAKTIVFVSLGVLLLIISFLYNKYKHLIADENVN